MPVNRFVVVVAESRYLAEDAVERILVDFEPLPAVLIWRRPWRGRHWSMRDLTQKCQRHVIQQKGDYEAVRGPPDHLIQRRFL